MIGYSSIALSPGICDPSSARASSLACACVAARNGQRTANHRHRDRLAGVVRVTVTPHASRRSRLRAAREVT